MKRILISSMVAILSLQNCEAKGNLDSFFNKLGSKSNFTQAGAYKDQAAGYYTGGGFALREGSTTVNPLTVSMPNYGAGCNNIDMYFGSISFVRSEQLVAMLKQLKKGVPTYGFQLALKSWFPMGEGLLSEIREKIEKMNALMLNSCQMSQQIVGGAWPKGTAASEQICMDAKRSSDMDWFGARNHCNQSESANALMSARDKHKDLMVAEYNLVWHIVKKMGNYSDSSKRDMAEFVMSIVGTLISVKEGNSFKTRIIGPRADQKEFVAAYLKGGQTTVLRCDETGKCLRPVPIAVTIDSSGEGNMKGKVLKRINDLRQAYLEKSIISEDDIGFLNDSVNVPVYKYIQVSAAAGTRFMLQDAAEYIAISLLLTQFERITTEILDAIDALEKVQLDSSEIRNYKKRVQEMRGLLQLMMGEANYGAIHTLNGAIKAIEQKIIAQNS
ncbi:MAG: conjugal transfer protein TraH [Candidatus Paracaedibacteraceae bacterium]|nr:conjugal transfer protein TraH [Candidatus Paracaedibacteraceae bacterium]